MVCVIPAAGRGSRMEGITNGQPKELLPLGRKPVLLRILLEARAADPDEIVVVTSREKTALVEQVELWAQTELADIPLRIAYQDRLNGVVGALAAAEVEDDLMVLLGDCVFDGSPVERMANLIHRGIDGTIAVEAVPDSQVEKYGIVDINEANGSVKRILEKPSAVDTESRWAAAARYSITKSLAVELEGFPLNRAGETTITDFLNSLLAKGADFRAIALQPDQRRFDCGSVDGYNQARREPWD